MGKIIPDRGRSCGKPQRKKEQKAEISVFGAKIARTIENGAGKVNEWLVFEIKTKTIKYKNSCGFCIGRVGSSVEPVPSKTTIRLVWIIRKQSFEVSRTFPKRILHLDRKNLWHLTQTCSPHQYYHLTLLQKPYSRHCVPGRRSQEQLGLFPTTPVPWRTLVSPLRGRLPQLSSHQPARCYQSCIPGRCNREEHISLPPWSPPLIGSSSLRMAGVFLT